MFFSKHFLLVLACVFVLPIDALQRRRPQEKKEIATNMRLISSAFPNNGRIPTVYTCDGRDISPPLRWENVPQGTNSFVLICNDPDARGGTWIHWLVFNLPGTVMHLPANANIAFYKGMEGMNNWGSNEYGGPCPPVREHRYVFDLYALSEPLRLKSTAHKTEVVRAMANKVLAKARLTGTYQRTRKKDEVVMDDSNPE